MVIRKRGEGQQLVFVEEGHRAQQEDLVETEQAEELQVTSALQPPPPPSLPPAHATEAEMEREQGKGESIGGRRIWKRWHHRRHPCRLRRKCQCRLTTGACAEVT